MSNQLIWYRSKGSAAPSCIWYRVPSGPHATTQVNWYGPRVMNNTGRLVYTTNPDGYLQNTWVVQL